MPKPYYPSPDEVQGAEPLNELVWFKQYQYWLVRLANTDWGRDLLLIDKRPYPVVAIEKNFVRFHLGVWDGQTHYMTDFRVGAKWGNVIRYRWLEVVKAIDRITLESILNYPLVYYRGRTLHPVGGGASLTVYPDPHPEDDTVDGSINQDTSNITWDAKHDASDGTTVTQSNETASINLDSRGTTDRYNGMGRFVALFDTSSLGAGSAVTATTLECVGQDKFAQWDVEQEFTVVLSNPASNNALVVGDFDTFQGLPGGGVHQSDDIALSDLTVNGYEVWTLTSTGRGNVSLSGISKFGLRVVSDTDDSEPTWENDHSDRFTVYTADESGTSTDTKLVVTYTPPPFTPRMIMF